MKKIKIPTLLSLLTITAHTYALPQEKTVESTHVYKNFAIQDVVISQLEQSYNNEILISRSHFEMTLVNNKTFKTPKIDKPIWTITANDLHVPEEACLDIDATLCRIAYEPGKPVKSPCYDTCITNGPRFVAYDKQSDLLYFEAGTDVSGTGGTPEFLFVADLNKKQIKYLNTFVGPYTAYLSKKGTYIAISGGYNEIEVCNTSTENNIEIRGDYPPITDKSQNHFLDRIRWLSDTELQYQDVIYNDKSQRIAYATKENIINVANGKIIQARMAE